MIARGGSRKVQRGRRDGANIKSSVPRSAEMAKALRTEFDNVDERIVEVAAPDDFDPRDTVRDITVRDITVRDIAVRGQDRAHLISDAEISDAEISDEGEEE
mgnify:CR=1 FL=1